nr:DUF2800 domain-containing protein [Candidatus Liberibacter solanacearum]
MEGRKGNRTFKDIEQATEYLTDVLGDKAFKKILLSPKEVEQFCKEHISSEGLWEELQELITRGDGKPVIAPRDIPPTPQIQKANISDFAVLT